MSLGSPESGISHESLLGHCPSCRSRGINNWTELQFLHDHGSVCGSCKAFLKGELEADAPDLKLYVRDMGKTRPSHVPTVPITPVTPSFVRETPIALPNSE